VEYEQLGWFFRTRFAITVERFGVFRNFRKRTCGLRFVLHFAGHCGSLQSAVKTRLGLALNALETNMVNHHVPLLDLNDFTELKISFYILIDAMSMNPLVAFQIRLEYCNQVLYKYPQSVQVVAMMCDSLLCLNRQIFNSSLSLRASSTETP